MGAAEPEMIEQITGGHLSPRPLPMGRANGLHLAGPISEAEPAIDNPAGSVACRQPACPDFASFAGQETARAMRESGDHSAVLSNDPAQTATGSVSPVAGASLPPYPRKERSPSDRLRGLCRPTFDRFLPLIFWGWSCLSTPFDALRRAFFTKFRPANAGFSGIVGG